MDNDSVLYILMDMRVNGVLDRILERDTEYQEIIQKSGEYSEKLDAMHLPPEVMDLIDHWAICSVSISRSIFVSGVSLSAYSSPTNCAASSE